MAYNWDGLPSRAWEEVETAYADFEAAEGKRWYTVEHGCQLSVPEIAAPKIGAAFVGETYHISVRVSESIEPEFDGEVAETGIPFTGTVVINFRGADYPLTYNEVSGAFEGEVQGPPASVWSVDDYTFSGIITATNDRGSSTREYAVNVYRPFPEMVSAEMGDCHVGEQTEIRAYARFTSIPESEEIKQLSFPGAVRAEFLGESYTLAPQGGNIFTATVTAPAVSSWPQENHQYTGTLIATLGEDEASMGFAVRVRESTPPEIVLQKPKQEMFISDDCSPLFRWAVSDSEAGVSRVEVTLDDRPHVYLADLVDGVACWQMPVVSAGVHTVTANCIDNDDNVATVVRELMGVELIRDRAASDLAKLKELDGTPRADMFPEQRLEWERACHRGGYTVADLSRVESAVAYLTNRLAEHGVELELTTVTDWKMTDKPSAAQMGRYLRNVTAVVTASATLYGLAPDVYGGFLARPEPPLATIDSLNLDTANRIEGALAAVEWFVDWLEAYEWYEETRSNTWNEVEAAHPTWDSAEGLTWGEVQLDPIETSALLLPWRVMAK